ncbi:hypothetical protein B005_4177 [Nocardiopsis alba ATCC BAA-2165]|uniref:Uncharacterized protein n=1 Tax=Nocardiopsis alba (strain ATCC BAA-2165 / BE74) TaxID=1205910 RepID=J7LG97_NOCAA|nr:hypothetical protein B005_4177 [Nocardiopsis alba ATCC BAA-2165]
MQHLFAEPGRQPLGPNGYDTAPALPKVGKQTALAMTGPKIFRLPRVDDVCGGR